MVSGIVPTGLVTVDQDLQLTRVNGTFCRLAGYRSGDLVGRPLTDLVRPDDLPTVRTLVDAVGGGDLAASHALVRMTVRSGLLRSFALVATPEPGGMACQLSVTPLEFQSGGRAPDAPPVDDRRSPPGAVDLAYRYRLWPQPAMEFVSATCEELTGYPPNAFYENPHLLLELLDDRGRSALQGAAEEEGPLSLRLHHRDGTVRRIEQRMTAIRDGANGVTAVECVARQVVDRPGQDQHLDDLREAVAMIRDIVAAASAAAARPEELHRSVLERTCRLRGWTLGYAAALDPEGTALEPGVWWSDDPERDRQLQKGFEAREWSLNEGILAEVFVTASPVEVSDATIRRAGFARVVAYPLQAEGQVVGALAFFLGDHDREPDPRFDLLMEDLGAYLGRQFRQARDEFDDRQRDTDRSEFLDAAAHQLRGPAGSIALMASALAGAAGELPTPELAAALEHLAIQAERVKHLTVRLLEMSQLEQGRLVVSPERVRVADAVGAAAGRVAVDPVVCVDPALVAVTDPVLLEEILVNLLDNAGRYGGPTIRVDAVVSHTRIQLSVSDDGPGLPRNVVEHGFRPLTAGMAGAERAGLGLAIVDRLARLAGGTLSYRAGEPQGARFTADLPAG
jgi:signal transduction histidine kinase/PAS domain-containing protein